MIRDFHVADFITLANAACGFGGVLLTMLYLQSGSRAHFYAAAAMAPLAFFFDWLDGNVARLRHEHSVLGRELDSLADVISFGVAPAALAYAAGIKRRLGRRGARLLRVLRGEPPRALQRHRPKRSRPAATAARSPISKALRSRRAWC
jgi:phosphatidylserine synthase